MIEIPVSIGIFNAKDNFVFLISKIPPGDVITAVIGLLEPLGGQEFAPISQRVDV